MPGLAAKFKWMLQAVELKNLLMRCFFKKKNNTQTVVTNTKREDVILCLHDGPHLPHQPLVLGLVKNGCQRMGGPGWRWGCREEMPWVGEDECGWG